MARNVTARDYHTQQIGYLRKRISFTDTVAVSVGKIPAGSLILKPISGVQIITAFNAGTNNFIDIGTSTTGDLYATDLAAGSVAFVPLDEAVSFYVTVDTEILVIYQPSSTAPTAGDAIVVISFIPPHPPSTTS